MKTLLVPVDFSDGTDAVIGQAGRLAAAFGSKVILLHVVEPVASYVPVGASMDVLTASPVAEPQDTSAAERRLGHLAEKFGRATPVESRVIVGLAVEEILEAAAQDGVDAIVVGSHGHGALYHLFTGSVVNGVLKKASCPVLIVPARMQKG